MSYIDRVKKHIDRWKENAEPGDRYMTVNNSSWHMKLFPEFHTTLTEIKVKIGKENADPMHYSTTSAVWDLKEDKAVWEWHSDPFPEPSGEDAAQYEIEEAERQAEAQRKIDEQKRILEHNTLVAELQRKAQEELLGKEDRYKVYVQECIDAQIVPLPYFQFENTQS
jgi:hypothetical protein